MKVALTGATGFIGSHVLAELLEHGHEVTALVRDDAGAETVTAKGATPAVVDLSDRPAVVSALSDAGGAIHTASPGDDELCQHRVASCQDLGRLLVGRTLVLGRHDGDDRPRPPGPARC